MLSTIFIILDDDNQLYDNGMSQYLYTINSVKVTLRIINKRLLLNYRDIKYRISNQINEEKTLF